MKEIEELIQTVSHRPWALQKGPWNYYQEWNNALFLHWKVSPDALIKLVPENLPIDKFNGESWVSLVAFTMERIRPRNLPSVSVISDFHEVNIRTYVTVDNKSGVYFLSIEAEKEISCFVAKKISGLRYIKANISIQENATSKRYSSTNEKKGFRLGAVFTLGDRIAKKSELENWLTERYCLYLDKTEKIYRYETHHKPWDLNEVKITTLTTDYRIVTYRFREDLIYAIFPRV